MSDRMEKVNKLLLRYVASAVTELLGREAGLITVTRVETSPDLRGSKVWVSIVSRDEEASMALLNERRGEIQREINPLLQMKYTPRIEFLQDTSGPYVEKMEKLFREIEQED